MVFSFIEVEASDIQVNSFNFITAAQTLKATVELKAEVIITKDLEPLAGNQAAVLFVFDLEDVLKSAEYE